MSNSCIKTVQSNGWGRLKTIFICILYLEVHFRRELMLAGGSVISWREQLRSDQLASLPSIHPSSFPPGSVLIWKLAELKLGISSVFWSFHQLAGVKFLPKAKDFEKLASLPSIHSSSFPPCSVLLWKLAETWDRFCLDSFDPFISSLVKNFYQKPKSLSRWRHFSSIQPFSFSPSIFYPPCTIFQSIWVVDTKAQLHQGVCQV